MYRKILTFMVVIVGLCFFTGCTLVNAASLPNPWVDCEMNLNRAYEVSGVKFPVALSNFSVRATNDMVEITYPIDDSRNIVLRKSPKSLGGDISGDFTNYPVTKVISLDDNVDATVKENESLIYVVNLKGTDGYYSIQCDKGMSLGEAKGAYDVIKNSENIKNPF